MSNYDTTLEKMEAYSHLEDDAMANSSASLSPQINMEKRKTIKTEDNLNEKKVKIEEEVKIKTEEKQQQYGELDLKNAKVDVNEEVKIKKVKKKILLFPTLFSTL